MKLTNLLERLDYKAVQGSDEIEITELVNDSRKVCEGSVFVCISGGLWWMDMILSMMWLRKARWQ